MTCQVANWMAVVLPRLMLDTYVLRTLSGGYSGASSWAGEGIEEEVRRVESKVGLLDKYIGYININYLGNNKSPKSINAK